MNCFFYRVVEAVFLLKNILIVILDPQEYSFGYGEKGSYILKLRKGSALLSYVESCDTGQLDAIVHSEEFRRGLMLLIKGEKVLKEKDIENLIQIKNAGEFANMHSENRTVYCEDDGASIYIINIDLDTAWLQQQVEALNCKSDL